MATIQFSEPQSEKKGHSSDIQAESTGVGGVYNLRNVSRGSLDRRISRSSTRDKFGNLEDAEDEDAGLRSSADFKTKQVRMPPRVRPWR